MLIDWFTVSAQALNFLILVWLMKRFLYKPILHAIDAREQLIATQLADADAKKNEAKMERDEYAHKNADFDLKRSSLLSQAKEEAKAERQILIDAARQEADALRVKRQETLKADAFHLNQSISNRAKQEVFAIVRKTLSDLATVSLEAQVVEVFCRRLRALDAPSKETMAKALKTASAPAIIRSANEFSVDQRTAIQNAINETFLSEVPVSFDTTPELICGIELFANGQSLAWSITDYLASLEKEVTELLQDNDKAVTKSNSATEVIANKKLQAIKPKANLP